MPETQWDDEGEEISLFTIGTLLLRNRWRITRWAIVGALGALALVWTRPALYVGSASFIPQGADAGRSSLASVAGQFGLSLPSASPTLSPDFYLALIKSRELLGIVARDTLTVPELGGKRMAVEDLLDIGPGSREEREESAVKELTRRIAATASKTTAIVDFSIGTKWPSVSLGIVTALMDGINEFNQRTRRDQAAAERKFVESRLVVASTELRTAEDSLQGFLQGNRQYGSPDLQFMRDRLQRSVTLRQQVFTSLMQAYDDVRMREARDTPVITIVDPPAVPSKPEPRGRGVRTLLGLMIGAVFGAMLIFTGDLITSRRAEGDPAVDEFMSTVDKMRQDMLRRIRWPKGHASG